MKFISVIGYSGSGKTYLIEKLIRKLKSELNLEVCVIKYIHEHRIDEEGKDSFKFSNSGAIFSVIKNKFNENAIFLKKEIDIDDLVVWLRSSPFKLDVIIFESFRSLPHPTILCVEKFSQIGNQINENVKMISGLITRSEFVQSKEINIPVINFEKDFEGFCKIFGLV